MLTICAWFVNLNAICEMQIMSGIRPHQRISEHKDSADSHREEHRLPKDSQFLFVFEPTFIRVDLITTLDKHRNAVVNF